MADQMRRATRLAYRDHLVRLLAGNDRIVCVDTDTGLFNGVDLGAAADRYVNVGIAEQNAMGIAAGLAAGGFVPFVNTFATFAAMRAVEAVKIDIAYNALPVRIAATHSGLSAGHFGPTHHALEDLAVMRCLPHMTVVVPADAAGTEALLGQTLDLPGPLYLRLGRKPTPPLPPAAQPPRLGLVQSLRGGADVLLAACGPHPVHAALGAADLLAADGIEAGVLNVHTVKPLDVAGLRAHAAGRALVVTVEEHWRAGGFGSAVAEALTETDPVRVLRIGVDDTFATVVGDHDALTGHYGITPAAVAARVRFELSSGPPVNEEEQQHGHRLSRM